MRLTRYFVLPAAAAVCFCLPSKSQAQTQVTTTTTETTTTGPNCPYGYYAYAPYHCAPRGYYGPEWFRNGRFIGAGPYYKGDRGFHGHIDQRYDEHSGYTGPYPEHTETYREYRSDEFHGNTMVTPGGEVWREEKSTTTTTTQPPQ